MLEVLDTTPAIVDEARPGSGLGASG